MLAISYAVMGVGYAMLFVELRFGSGRYRWWVTAALIVVAFLVFLPGSHTLKSILDAVCVMGCLAVILAYLWTVRRRAVMWDSDHVNAPRIALPFKSGIRILIAGPTRNHHVPFRDQRYAVDLVPAKGKAFGKTILSPVKGTVISAIDGILDRLPSRNPDHPSAKNVPLGNHVVICTATNDGDAYLFMCHLQQGSVCVTPGQALEVRDRIGNCGNSGRTTRPHLHLHMQKEPEFEFNVATGVPFCFAPSAGAPYPGIVAE